ncbi:hypothetical protein R1sor_009867 [Riccia sorocarpa]|uniref:F-box domain-containing protein n=1 Tax=Riccia sorocarpa TaxID=122646 RepID=A0ABD3HXT2_9MARC
MAGHEPELGLWEQLPSEMIRSILGKLPLKSLCVCRSVCSQWKTMIDDGQVVYAGVPAKSTIFYCQPALRFYHHSEDLAVEEGSCKPLLAFPNRRRSLWEWRNPSFVGSRDLSVEHSVLMAADGGLLCFSCFSTNPGPDNLVIYNPLTGRWRVLTVPLPVFPKLSESETAFVDVFRFLLVGLIMDEESGNYKLVVAGIEKDGPRETHLYDSAKMTWRLSSPVPTLPEGEWGNWRAERAVCCRGNIYWHVYADGSRNAGVGFIHGLLKFDVGVGSWTFVKEDRLSAVIDLHMVVHEEELLLLRFMLDDDYLELEDSKGDALELEELGPEVEYAYYPDIDLHFGYAKRQFLDLVDAGDDLLRILVHDEAVWLPRWDLMGRTDTEFFCTFIPTLRAFV